MTEPNDVIAYNDGVRLFKEGKTLQALERFRFAAETGEDRPMEHFALASACLQVGDKAGAEKEYRRFLDMEPGDNRQVQVARATIARLEKERVEARAHEEAEQRALTEKLRQERLLSVRKLYDEAVGFFRVGGYDSCLSRLETLAESWGRTAEVLNLQGLCFKHLGQLNEATQTLENAIQADPDHVDAALNLAQLHFETGVQRARKLIEGVLSSHPDNASAWFNLGVLTLASGNTAGARMAWEKASKIDPEDQRTIASLKMVETE